MTADIGARPSTAPSSALQTINSLRERLVLFLWAGGLGLILYSLYDMPSPAQHPLDIDSAHLDFVGAAKIDLASQHLNLRGDAGKRQERWQPYLEEEARAISMLNNPFGWFSEELYFSNK